MTMAELRSLLLVCLSILLLTSSSSSGGTEPENEASKAVPKLDTKKDVASTNGTDLFDAGSTLPNPEAKNNRLDKVKNKGSTSNGESGKVVGDSISSDGKGKDEKKDKKKSSDGVGVNKDPKGTEKEDEKTPLRKEESRAEECDPSNRCTAEEGKLVACLRLPGDDSPGLSLLIQNKGKGSLTVTISAPDLVELKDTEFQVKEGENHEVMVSIGKLGSQSSISLTAGTDSCSLDLRDMIRHNTKDSSGLGSSLSSSVLGQKPMTVFIIFSVLFVLTAVGVYIGVRKKLILRKNSKYQRLDVMELPVSNARKPESSDSGEGWDESWGDGWDDEEVPKTPSKPVTPSVSSKGLAPRRATKEGWKD